MITYSARPDRLLNGTNEAEVCSQARELGEAKEVCFVRSFPPWGLVLVHPVLAARIIYQL
jgi:hypothetical protein